MPGWECIAWREWREPAFEWCEARDINSAVEEGRREKHSSSTDDGIPNRGPSKACVISGGILMKRHIGWLLRLRRDLSTPCEWRKVLHAALMVDEIH